MPQHLRAIFAHFAGLSAATPSSSLLASIGEDGGDAGGGGDGDVSATSPTVTPTSAAAPAAAEEKRYTVDEVNRIVADRLARDRGDRGGRRPSSGPASTPDHDKGSSTLSQRLERLETEAAFYRGLSAAGVTPSEDQAQDLLELFRVQKPERPGEWIATKSKLFGIGPRAQPAMPAPPAAPTQAAPAVASPTQPTTPPAAPSAAADGAAPNAVDPLNSGGFVDVSRLSQAELAKLGPDGVRAHLERIINDGRGRDGRPAVPAALRKK